MNDIYLRKFDCGSVSCLRHSIDPACYSYHTHLSPLKGLKSPVRDDTSVTDTVKFTTLIPKSPVRDDISLSPVRDDTSVKTLPCS